MLRRCEDRCSWQDEMFQFKSMDGMAYILLTAGHCVVQGRRSTELRDCMKNEWFQVLFTDETRFSLENDTRRVKAGISISGRTNLHINRKGNLTMQRYAYKILRPHVTLCADIICLFFSFNADRLVENIPETETGNGQKSFLI
ncbi:hypothetical protein TNCV_3665151 [Trichonephila clavipes]|nr:hypothetical protein TNCV_3665151 [Trichonephila clavipes]